MFVDARLLQIPGREKLSLARGRRLKHSLFSQQSGQCLGGIENHGLGIASRESIGRGGVAKVPISFP